MKPTGSRYPFILQAKSTETQFQNHCLPVSVIRGFLKPRYRALDSRNCEVAGVVKEVHCQLQASVDPLQYNYYNTSWGRPDIRVT